MTDTLQSSAPRTRRALLAGGLGALGAVVAGSLRPPAVLAGADGDVVLGSAANASASTTKITVPTQDYSAFWAESTGDYGVGVRGDANQIYGTGVMGNAASQAGNGVKGTSAGTGVFGDGGLQGVYGFSTTGIGVYGVGPEDGVRGTSSHGVGVKGESGDGSAVAGTSTSGRGIEGRSTSAFGVYGRSEQATGVFGHGGDTGVRGESSQGIGVEAVSTTGLAFRTSGRIHLHRVSGVATIPTGKTSVTVAPTSIDVTTTSFVLLTPKLNLGTRALWFTTNPTANTITIRISSARGSVTPVSWLLLD